MKNKFIFLLVFTLIATFGLFSVFSRATSPSQENEAPVFWLSDTELVVLTDQAIILRKLNSQASDEVVFTLPKDFNGTSRYQKNSCFSDTMWHVRWSLDTEDFGRRYDELRYEVQVHDGRVTHFEKKSPDIGMTINPFDCSVVEDVGHGGVVASSKDQSSATKFQSSNTVFSPDDAQYVRIAHDDGTTLIGYETQGIEHQIEIEVPIDNRVRWNRSLDVVRSNTQPSYLFYRKGRDFNAKPDAWPMIAWLADLELHTATRIEIPAGPWVGEHKERLRCFSCGCGCYRRLDLFLVNDKIYGHASGIGYPKKVQGIYRLDEMSSARGWTPIVTGTAAASVTFSKSGCKLAYIDPSLVVLDICKPS